MSTTSPSDPNKPVPPEPSASKDASAKPVARFQSRRPRVGDALIEDGAITQAQLDRALAEQRTGSRRLGELLVDQGTINSATLVRALGRTLGVKGCQLRHGLVDPALLKLLPEEEWTRLCAIPMFNVKGTLTVAMAEPQSLPSIDRLRQMTGLKVRAVLALEANIVEYIKKYSGGNVDVDAFLTSLSDSNVEVIDREQVDERQSTDLDRMIQGSPIVNLVNVTFLQAVRDKASDIHIEPDKRGTRIRYRIDGVLRDLMKPPPGLHAAIASRVKVIGKMDIAEKRMPQEGRVRIVAEGREIDLRVSSIPTLLGEKIVVRVLDKSNLRVRMEELGFRPKALEALKRSLEQSHGLCLVTGPTGSGKTTTLYSALELLRGPDVNIVTVEDPVEYQLDLVNQIQVNEQCGLSFAKALRSILRQDPDIIMVGEIRDHETARVAVQAALTGHLVLATLHTNDAPSATARLADMGIEPYLLSAALNGVVAQRLTRTNCSNCETKYYPAEHYLTDAGIADNTGMVFKKGVGCNHCHNSGFQGRMGVYEVMEVTPQLRRMIHKARPVHELREEANRGGALTLRQEAVLVAISGRTSLEEVLRITQVDEDIPVVAAPAAAAGVVPTVPADDRKEAA